MCGRTTITVSKEMLERYYSANFNNEFTPTYNAAPSQLLPIVRQPKKIELAKWGFLPKWMKEKRPQGFINTRAETAFEKPTFKKAMVSQRCLIPADGFFEWMQQTGAKQPYYITLKNKGLFSLAGLWQEWTDDQGKDVFTYSILTTAPNKLMAKIHDRMPVILGREEETEWLDYNLPVKKLANLLDPFPDELMAAVPISKLVNDVHNNTKEIIKPLTK